MHSGAWFLLPLMAVAGFFLGILYFLGLWKQIQGLNPRKKFAGRMISGFLVRLLLLMAVFFLLMDHDWKRLTALTAGFLCARQLMLRRACQSTKQKVSPQLP